MTTMFSGFPIHLRTRTVLILACLLLPLSANAERADREQPAHVKADNWNGNDLSKIHVYTGNVKVTQGTRLITADKVVVTEDADGYYNVVATSGTGGLARFREKREAHDDYVEGEAERIEYDTRNDKTKLFERAYVKNGSDEARGRYIERDGYTENFKVTNGPNGTSVKNSTQIEVTLFPKTKTPAKP